MQLSWKKVGGVSTVVENDVDRVIDGQVTYGCFEDDLTDYVIHA